MATDTTKTARRRRISFRYEALAEGQRRVKGTVRAASEIAAQNELVERGYDSITLFPAPPPLSLEGAIPSLFKVKPTQIITFSRQLATLLESGVMLLPAIQLLAQQRSSSPPFRRVLMHVLNDLSTGNSLSFALSRHEQVFNEVFRRTIEVGERTGSLQTVLRNLADHVEKQAVIGKKLKAALTYPVILLVVGAGVTIVLLTVVLPPLADLFGSFEAELPLPTRVMMSLSEFVNGHLVYLMVASAVVVIGIPVYFKHPKGRRSKEKLLMKAPLIGGVIVMGELARIGRTMSLMLSAGLTLQETMEILPQTTTNGIFRSAMERIRQQLFLGEGLAFPMAANPMFPPLMLQMVRVGEDSNTLSVTMGVVADFYEGAAEERTTAMVSMITPLSTIFLASLVGFVALSVIMPMYNITNAF